MLFHAQNPPPIDLVHRLLLSLSPAAVHEGGGTASLPGFLEGPALLVAGTRRDGGCLPAKRQEGGSRGLPRSRRAPEDGRRGCPALADRPPPAGCGRAAWLPHSASLLR